MTPSITAVRLTGARHRAELPLLVLGPLARHLRRDAVDGVRRRRADRRLRRASRGTCPGHGHNRAVPEEPFTMAELAAGVLHVVDDIVAERGDDTFFYAGDSVGGAVGLQLLLDVPARVPAAVLLCTGARIGTHESWTGRMAQVSMSGTPVMVSGSAERWFGAGFLEREPARGSALLHALQDAGDEGYVAVCGALAEFDVRDRLAEIGAPVLAVAGAEDVSTPVENLREIAEGVKDGRLVVLDGVAHLAPGRGAVGGGPAAARAPAGRACPSDDRTVQEVRDAGMAVRREVLGDAHVDRATPPPPTSPATSRS